MPFPKSLEELKAAGYVFSNHAACKGCGATVEWFTTPKGKKMPMDVDTAGNVVSHFSTCKNAEDFRK